MACNSTELVLDFLHRYGPASPQVIGRACRIQHNTVIKDFKFLRDRGIDIRKTKRLADGVTYYEYYVAKEVKSDKPKSFDAMTLTEKINELKRIVSEYPKDHAQAKTIREHIAELERLSK